ncbi:lipoyl(octanoyl) transferase LipB [Oleispirillum naphthae]|uniref:lipoyl(octanoyl) transferase LipB n=1 Tax=Oleispirillum naphthae TaxID=2838853 RepID=UPI003082250D
MSPSPISPQPATGLPVTWLASAAPVPYPEAVAFMEDRVAAIRAGAETQAVWLLEHPPLYTAGTSADPKDLLMPDRFPVYASGRGGQYTYHGPGQRVIYVMLDIKRFGADVRAFVHALETWGVAALARMGVAAEPRADRVGLWVDRGGGREDKIAAIGVRVRRWVSFHGMSVNVCPDLSHFSGIVPCGIADHGVTSLADLGMKAAMADLDAALAETFAEVFGPLAKG